MCIIRDWFHIPVDQNYVGLSISNRYIATGSETNEVCTRIKDRFNGNWIDEDTCLNTCDPGNSKFVINSGTP